MVGKASLLIEVAYQLINTKDFFLKSLELLTNIVQIIHTKLQRLPNQHA